MRNWIIIIAIILLAVFNPDKKDFSAYRQKKAAAYVGDTSGFTELFLKKPANVIAEHFTKRMNFVLFSAYKTEIPDENFYHTGILGDIFRTPQKELDKENE